MGDEKRYYWLKLKDDFFKSRKMKKLRKVAGGDTYTIIYLKLQLLSINNDGVIEFEGTDEDIFHQLSLDIDEEIDDIKMTVAFCTANDLIEVQEQDLFLNDVPKLIGSETQAARRMRRKRAKDSKAIEGGTNGNNVQTLRNNVTEGRNNVRSCYTEKEIDIESPPIRRCGLKLYKKYLINTINASPPIRRCGLKSLGDLILDLKEESPPIRRCGLKSGSRFIVYDSFKSHLPYGGVD